MSNQQPLDFSSRRDVLVMSSDPSRNRSRNSQESADAHEKIVEHKSEMYNRIMALVRARKGYGVTVHEVANAFGKTPNEVSGRLSELRLQLNKLKKSGERRGNAAVLIEA